MNAPKRDLTKPWSARSVCALLCCFGVAYALLVPPFQSPDEPNHFFRAWQVSEGHFFPEKMGNRLGGSLPASLGQLSNTFAFLRNDTHAKLQGDTWRLAMTIALDSEHRCFTDFANTAIYAPTAYIPQATAIAVLRPLGATPLQLLYATRLANVFVWILLIMAALHRATFLRSTLVVMALLPASVCLAASANADVVTNGLCWWIIVSLIATPILPMDGKKWIVLVIVSINKLIAVPLGLLGLFFKNDRRTLAVFIGVGLMAALWWSRLAQDWFIPHGAYDPHFRDTQTLNSGVNPTAQLAFMVENPLFFVKITTKSLIESLPSMGAHFVGKFGWEKNYLSSGWILLLWVALMATIFSTANPLSVRQRGGMMTVTVLYVVAFSVTMYALWCAVGAARIDNWQGRYFVPIAPVAALAVASNWLGKWQKNIHWLTLLAVSAGNVAMMARILERYW